MVIGTGCTWADVQLQLSQCPAPACLLRVTMNSAVMLWLQTPAPGATSVFEVSSLVLLVQVLLAWLELLRALPTALTVGTAPTQSVGKSTSSASLPGGSTGVSITVAVALAPEAEEAWYVKLTGSVRQGGKWCTW